MHIQDIRLQSPAEEIDYLFLKDILKGYAQPRNKIRYLLQSKSLIRVKKGLYVFGPTAARGPYCKEVLANQIYGPSAISLEYALGYYGLIPERVEEVTSITTGRNKIFETPIGRFSYRHLNLTKYPIGIDRIEFSSQHPALISTPEKALCDMLMLKINPLDSLGNLETYLFEDLRLDDGFFNDCDIALIAKIANAYHHHNVDLLLRYSQGV